MTREGIHRVTADLITVAAAGYDLGPYRELIRCAAIVCQGSPARVVRKNGTRSISAR